VAHSLVGTLAARFAARHSSLLSRLLIYASSGVVRYRMPLGLRYRALRFAVRPTARNFERFQRFALLDRDSTRERDPEWFDAFSEYTMARAHAPEVKATMGRLFTTRLHWPLFTVEGAAHVPHIEQPQLFVDVLHAACASD
jgi:2-hydroxymuconate-semialdehyde hydrolase